jgi:hypothetical protein
MAPGGVIVEAGAAFEAAVEDAYEPVGYCKSGPVVGVTSWRRAS